MVNRIHRREIEGLDGEIVLLPEDFGAVGDGVADDTAAINAMVAHGIALADAGTTSYIVMQFAAKTYLLSSAPTAPEGAGGPYAQIPLPTRAVSLANVVVLEFRGAGRFTKGEVPSGFTVLKSTAAGGLDASLGVASVIGGPAVQGSGSDLSVLNVILDSLVIRRPDNPSIAGADFTNCFTARTRNVTFDTDTSSGTWATITTASHVTNVALMMPKEANNAISTCEGETLIAGAYVGIGISEHFTADHLLMYRNVTGIAPSAGYHGSVILHANIEHTTHIIAGHSFTSGAIDSPTAYLHIALLDIEDAPDGSDTLGTHILDAADALHLTGNYVRVKAVLGTQTGPLTMTGGANVNLVDLTDAPSVGPVSAADVTYAGGPGLSATDVEAALDELATEKSDTTHTHPGGSGYREVLMASGVTPPEPLTTTAETDWLYGEAS